MNTGNSYIQTTYKVQQLRRYCIINKNLVIAIILFYSSFQFAQYEIPSTF